MSEDFSDLIEAFEEVGISRGFMNGRPLHVVADPRGGYSSHGGGQEEFLKSLRAYEKRTGRTRSWKDSHRMQIRSAVTEALAKKKKRNEGKAANRES